MAMPKKPEGLKKVGVNVTLSPALIATINEVLEPGQSRSVWIEEALTKALKLQGIKLQKIVKK